MQKPSSIPNQYLEIRLQIWAIWEDKMRRGEIGWPSESIMSVMLTVGTVVRGSAPAEMQTNEKAEEINSWVRRMGERYPTLEAALRAYYLAPKLPLRVLAESQKISISAFKERLKDAKIWLDGRISEGEN